MFIFLKFCYKASSYFDIKISFIDINMKIEIIRENVVYFLWKHAETNFIFTMLMIAGEKNIKLKVDQFSHNIVT